MSAVRVSSTNDVSLALHELGGDGPPLLIAHATGFCAGAYRPFAQHLLTTHRVFALDFRAHGESTGPADDDLSWEGMIDDVLAVVDAIGAGPIPAFGHSMGGACLLGAELRRPGTLTRAMVFEPIVFPAAFAASTEPNPLAISARRRRATFDSRPAALARYASRPPLGTFRADVLHAYVEHGFVEQADGSVTLRCTPEHEAHTFEAPGKPELEAMDAVGIPVLVAAGRPEDRPGPADLAPHIAEALPHGELRPYRHLSHFGPFQDPLTLAEDLLAFLG